ncbi:cAMP-regulated phosphoprotein 21-like isoform X2 [Leptotrombidium deliense]|uniref:cAMP-regulated phosphoprotein 21-like isoform X2 n=1 Tax=Leptotrombidium deliense TaxID=299467 RepID=A0A443STL8_9ACAR|nr:cAMP-regulated phosphoprotein 21-like isoform X2 [Leptotrombidium deliense]
METVVKDERVKDNQSTKSQRRLSKQEEVDFGNDGGCNGRNEVITDNGFVVPVTIHVEDRGDVIPEVDAVYKSTKRLQQLEDCLSPESEYTSPMHLETTRQSMSLGSQLASNGETVTEKDKKRSKVLIRSKALSDDASPPPDIEALRLNTNRLSNQKGGSQGSSQGSNDGSSPSLSRDSSTETYTDSTGTDLQQFLIETLQNPKDRIHLLKFEQEMTTLVKDKDRQFYKFPQMSSYHRMLVHRVAAFFGMEHNVDTSGNAVVVNKSKSTRIPDMKFSDYVKEGNDEPKKLILKRDSASFEESSGQCSNNNGKEKSPDRRGGNSNLSDSRRSKSFEEREERYEKARARIFNQGSSSSTSEAAETNANLSSENEQYFGVASSADRDHKSSSPLNSHDDKANWNVENKQWSSTDSECSGRPHHLQLQKQNRLANSLDSDTTKSITASSSMSSSNGMFLTPDSCISDRAITCNEDVKPSVTKASSFGGMTGLNYENSSTSKRLTKAVSINMPRSSDSNYVSSGAAFTTPTFQELKQQQNQTQSQLSQQQSSQVSTPASHSNATLHRKQVQQQWPPNSSMPQFHQSQPQQHMQPQPVQIMNNQMHQWTGYHPNNSMLVFGNPMGNVYRNAGDASKNAMHQVIANAGPPGQAYVYMPYAQPQQSQPVMNGKQMNSNNSNRTMNHNRSLTGQFSAMSFNSQMQRETRSRKPNGGKNENYQKQSFGTSQMQGTFRPHSHALPMNAASNGQYPFCYLQPQTVNGPANQATVVPEHLIYQNSTLQPSIMFLGSNPGLANQYQNSIPVQLQQIPVPIPQQTQSASAPPPHLPSQSQVIRNIQPSVQQAALHYPVPYQFVNQVHPSQTSQVSNAGFQYGAAVKPQMSHCLPVYMVSNGNSMSANQATTVRPMGQSGALLPTPYTHPRSSLYLTPSPPQTAQTPPLALPASGPSQYVGYTICTSPPSASAVNNAAINQNAALSAAASQFMTMFRAHTAAAAMNPANLGNQLNHSGANRIPHPNHRVIPNHNPQRYNELADFQASNSNKYSNNNVPKKKQ